jgi:hypothetical protein
VPDVDRSCIVNRFFQLFLEFALRFAKDVIGDLLAGFGIVPCGVAVLPSVNLFPGF